MEDPSGWDRLTASLDVSLAAGPEKAWDFLVREKLVRPGDAHRARFLAAVAEYRSVRHPPGPSEAMTIAGFLREEKIARCRGIFKDPQAKRARARFGETP